MRKVGSAACLLLALGGIAPLSAETVLVESGSAIRFLANTADPGATVESTWFTPGFDDGGWSSGSYGIGSDDAPPGSGAHALIATSVPSGTRSVYTRTTFDLADAAAVFSLHLGLDYDDGVVAWINGVEVYRSPEMRSKTLIWQTYPLEHESSNGQTPDYFPLRNISAAGIPALQNEDNVLAVAVWNSGTSTGDLLVVPRLSINKLLTRAPYLQQGTPGSVVVRWRTGNATDSRVLFGSAPGGLGFSATDSALKTEHEMTLGGLLPNTRYYYAVGTGSQLLAGDDAEHFFDTPPAVGTPKPTRIWVLGDSGTGELNPERVRDSYSAFTGARHTELWLMLGDNAYPHGTDLEYQENLFDIYAAMLSKSVLWPTNGNHDLYDGALQTWPYYDLFTLPKFAEAGGVASGTESYYGFDYANIHFVVLDSQDGISTPGSAMHTWLKADLADTQQEWIIAFWHHPPYSKGVHDSDDPLDSGGRLIAMRQNIVPVLDDYGVDLVLCGHSHSYERSYLINGHYGPSVTWNPLTMLEDGGNGSTPPYVKPERGNVPYLGSGEGAVYSVSGSSALLSFGKAASLGGTEPDYPAMFVTLFELGSVILDVNGNRLDAAFLDDLGNVRDSYAIVKGNPPQPPVADFRGTPLIASPPATVAFDDLSLNEPTVWSWDFDDDGQAESQGPAPTHVYGQSGLYSVKLSVSNFAGADDEIKTGYICVTGGAPGVVGGMVAEPDKTTLRWDVEPNATAYDVVKGDLTQAVLSGGLAGTVLDCLTATAPEVWDTTTPPAPGQVFFYVARGTNCAGQIGTYDGGGPGQVAPRDPVLAGPGGCGASGGGPTPPARKSRARGRESPSQRGQRAPH